MIFAIRSHVAHHFRFYAAFLIGVLAYMGSGTAGPYRLIAAADAFYIVYLVLVIPFVIAATPERHRDRASYADEGVFLIFLITTGVIVVSLAAIFEVLRQKDAFSLAALALSVASVPLGWLMFHTVASFHYAHLFYTKRTDGTGGRQDRRGLVFPGTREPAAWDFLYYSFVIGMTAQVSDVQVTDAVMRRLTLLHGVVSFFFNTVILTLAVNVAVTLAG